MLQSINKIPKFKMFLCVCVCFKENIQKGKNFILFLWDKPLHLCKSSTGTTHRVYLYTSRSIIYYTEMSFSPTGY